MILNIDEATRKVEELKGSTLSWTPSMSTFFGFFMNSMGDLFKDVETSARSLSGEGGTRTDEIPKTHEELMSFLGGHRVPDNMKERFGHKMVDVEKAPGTRAILPSGFDWRNKDGKNYITSVKQQGFASSCVAFGVAGAMESVFHVKNDKPIPAGEDGLNLSEQQLYFYNKEALEGKINCMSGWNIPEGLEYAQSDGLLTSEDFCDYNPYNVAFRPPKHKLPDEWKELSYKIANYQIITNEFFRTEEIAEKMRKKMKESIIECGPIVSKVRLYPEMVFYKDGIYKPLTTYDDKIVPTQYHCILIIGYDDEKKAWLCKNSWGKLWGEEGFFRIEYGQCGIEDEVYVIQGIE